MKNDKFYVVNLVLNKEEYYELIYCLECDVYDYIGNTERQQKNYEKKIKKMRDTIKYKIQQRVLFGG